MGLGVLIAIVPPSQLSAILRQAMGRIVSLTQSLASYEGEKNSKACEQANHGELDWDVDWRKMLHQGAVCSDTALDSN